MENTPQTQRMTNPWLVLALLLGISLFYYADRYLISGLVGPIKEEFGVGDSFMGRLMGFAFAVFTALLAIPFARYADRSSYVRTICGGCIFWSLSTMLSGLATEPWMLAAARIGVGIGEAAFSAPAYALIAAYFPVERRTLALTIFGLAIYIGQVGGYAVGPIIAEDFGWRSAFLFVGAPGIIIASIAWAVIKEPQRSSTIQAPPALMRFLLVLIRRPSYAFTTAGVTLGVLSGMSFGLWGPALFSRVFEIPQKEASGIFGLYFGLPGMFGMLMFGAIGNKLIKRGAHWLLLMSAASLMATSGLILAVTWVPTLEGAKLLALASGTLGGGWAIGAFAALQYLLPERVRATGTALLIMVQVLIGMGFGPALAGDISEAYGDTAASLRLGLTVAVLAGIPGAVLLALGARFLVADRAMLYSMDWLSLGRNDAPPPQPAREGGE